MVHLWIIVKSIRNKYFFSSTLEEKLFDLFENFKSNDNNDKGSQN